MTDGNTTGRDTVREAFDALAASTLRMAVARPGRRAPVEGLVIAKPTMPSTTVAEFVRRTEALPVFEG